MREAVPGSSLVLLPAALSSGQWHFLLEGVELGLLCHHIWWQSLIFVSFTDPCCGCLDVWSNCIPLWSWRYLWIKRRLTWYLDNSDFPSLCDRGSSKQKADPPLSRTELLSECYSVGHCSAYEAHLKHGLFFLPGWVFESELCHGPEVDSVFGWLKSLGRVRSPVVGWRRTSPTNSGMWTLSSQMGVPLWGLGSVALMEDVYHWGWALRMYSLPYFQFTFSDSCLWSKTWVPSFLLWLPYLPAAVPSAMLGSYPPGIISPDKLLSINFLGHSTLQSNRKAINTVIWAISQKHMAGHVGQFVLDSSLALKISSLWMLVWLWIGCVTLRIELLSFSLNSPS